MVPLKDRQSAAHHVHRQSSVRKLCSVASSFFASALLHAMFALVLALIVYQTFKPEPVSTLLVSESVPEPIQPLQRDLEEMPVALPEENVRPLSVQSAAANLPSSAVPAVFENVSRQIEDQRDALSAPYPGYRERFKNSFDARRGELRDRMVQEHGGTPESERAVEEGLKWLARHQRKNGSWSFDHRCPDCDKTCQGAGGDDHTAGATALAVLCFLGAGHTHQEGEYQEEVRAGLRYLLSQRGPTRVGGDYTKGGTMYIQGFVGIALAEAYGMTRDDFLEAPAVAALDFIAEAQDPQGGGWRYRPGQAGDTSVVGWQVMALTSGRIADLGHWRLQRGRTMKFLDSVQTSGGAYYGYTSKGAKPSTTAVGLLCRIYLGWNNRVALQRGVRFLAKRGPESRDMYYNYYATQVLHHWGGRDWDNWNETMRDRLVSTQTTTGHGAGSWDTNHCRWGGRGGRLYVTCLSILTLEVYYRHLPLYQVE